MRRLSIIYLFLVLSSLSSQAQKNQTIKCLQPKLNDFTVFAIENILGQNSDYQGMVGAGGHIELTNFFVGKKDKNCLSISAGGDVYLSNILVSSNVESRGAVNVHSADIRGFIKAYNNIKVQDAQVTSFIQTPRKMEVVNASVRSKLKSQPQLSASTDHITKELYELSSYYSAQSNNSRLRPNKNIRDEDFIEIELKKGLNILNLSAQLFKVHKNLFIHGQDTDQLILQIQDEDIELNNLTVHLTGGIEPQQIVWNMAQAKSLFIRNTGHPAHGIPGRILAPFARVQFYEGLISGSIWAHSIDYNHALGPIPSGQVNGDGFNGQQPFE